MLPFQRSSSRWKLKKVAFATLLEYVTVILTAADRQTDRLSFLSQSGH